MSKHLQRLRGGRRIGGLIGLLIVVWGGSTCWGRDLVRVTVETPQPPPGWAVLQQELLRANVVACREFFQRYFDERGYLLCVERWGGDDGPDDAIETLTDWPLLHALGASDEILTLYKRAWEGHLRQYTQAKTTAVPFAKQGMYYKEFPVMFDWLHNGEGLVVFNLQGLSDPHDRLLRQRATRYAGFYLNEDPAAPNYDPQHKIIRSMFNGSRGPLLRKATALDWAGDPIEIENRFKPRHGERTFAEMLAHFQDYNDIVGDHPQNLQATTLATNAFLLTHDDKYKRWILEYVDAWRERMAANGGIIPTNIGLDGKIGGGANGKWYGGVYGWGFSPLKPEDGKRAHRNRAQAGFHGFMNAYLLTGDDRYLEPWRKQIDTINSHQKNVDGVPHYPHMHGDTGWYDYRPEKYAANAFEIYQLSQRPEDLLRVPAQEARLAWVKFLAGENPKYVETVLQADFAKIRSRVQLLRADTTTPDTRLADDPIPMNPASVQSLLQLAMGGNSPGNTGGLLFCRLRYFDADARRAGLPVGVGALIEKMTADQVTLSLVNTSPVDAKQVVVQGGAYGEHQLTSVTLGKQVVPVQGRGVLVHLAPGCGTRLVIQMQRFSQRPTLAFPWDE